MAFKQGKSGNPKGRPKGAKNKDLKSLRERIDLLLDNQFDTLVTDLEKLKPVDRIKAILSLLEYSTPKLQRVEASHSIDNLNDEQVEEIYNKLISKL